MMAQQFSSTKMKVLGENVALMLEFLIRPNVLRTDYFKDIKQAHDKK